MKIGMRLALGFAVIIALTAIMAVLSIINFGVVQESIDDIIHDKYPKAKSAYEVIENINIIARSMRNILIYKESEIPNQIKRIDSCRSAILNEIKFLESKITTEEGKKHLAELIQARINYVGGQDDFINLMKRSLEDKAQSQLYRQNAARLLEEEIRIKQNNYFNACDKLINYQDEMMHVAENNADKADSTAILTNWILLAVSLVISVLLAWFIMRSITKPISISIDAANNIAKGDMNVKFDTTKKDETGQLMKAMKQMADTVQGVVTDVKELALAASNGMLDKRADGSKYQGEYKSLVDGFNYTLDAVIKPMNVTAEYVDRISKGDIPAKITDEYKGDFNEIKNNLNLLIDSTNNATQIAINISQGNLDNEIRERCADDKLMKSLNTMTNSIKEVVNDTLFLAGNAIKGKIDIRVDEKKHTGDYLNIVKGIHNTLDSIGNILDSTNNLMVADEGGIIQYMNKPVTTLLTTYENNIRQQYPMFAVSRLKGSNIDEFHKNPSHNRMLLSGLNKPHEAIINVGDKIFKLIITPLNDSAGKRIGYTVQWANYTSEAGFEKNMKSLIDNIINGNLKSRIDADKLEGTYKDISNNINQMLTSIVTPLYVAADYVNRISKGDIPPKINDNYNGDFNELKNNLNTCIEAVNALILDSKMLSDAAVEGKLNTRADITKHQGDFKRIVEGFNNTLDSVLNPINEAVEVLKQMAEGNLSIKVQGQYKGDHAIIKNALNTTIDLMPFNEAVRVLKEMADGNLTMKMEGAYKGDSLVMKNAVNDTITAMNEILIQVRATVEEVSRGSMQVSDAATALSQGATESASSLEEITSSMAEIGSQTKLNAENANHANLLTNEAKDAAEKGNHEMGSLNSAMSEINESSKNISKIIKVIDEIAFQTNLLALNAAVEAARAGRHGKGFAVVAEEVRNLAARSASAAKETADLIENSIKVVENGSSLALRTGEALDEIRKGAIKAADIVGEIATSSNEQAQGIAQINQGLSQIDKVTQTNTASAEESASASEELSGQAANLKEMISKFRLRDEGKFNKYQDRDSYSGGGGMMLGGRPQSRKLPQAKHDFGRHRDEMIPEDIIKLEDDDFGKY
ncbi:MAG: methyl-accepting chemotaxis protein [Bacteroidota bacterium]|nr:methyl-accepting chemotaxis protein [Bacteroidota bacterium]